MYEDDEFTGNERNDNLKTKEKNSTVGGQFDFISIKMLKIALQIYIIVVRNKKNLHLFTFLL